MGDPNSATPPEAITVNFPDKSAADDSKFVNTLVKIVNAVYSKAEEGIFLPGYKRTTPAEVADLIRGGKLAVAHLGQRGHPAGCIVVRMLSPTRGAFGMLALDSAHRGGGFGRQLVSFAEQYCRNLGCAIMQLELLVPTTFNHAFKQRMQAWYLRMGYKIVSLGQFEKDYPSLAPLLTGPTEYRIFEKALV